MQTEPNPVPWCFYLVSNIPPSSASITLGSAIWTLKHWDPVTQLLTSEIGQLPILDVVPSWSKDRNIFSLQAAHLKDGWKKNVTYHNYKLINISCMSKHSLDPHLSALGQIQLYSLPAGSFNFVMCRLVLHSVIKAVTEPTGEKNLLFQSLPIWQQREKRWSWWKREIDVED